MTNKFVIFIFIFLQMSCKGEIKKIKDFKVINKYYKAYNSKKYRKLDKIIDDNIQIIEMNYTVLDSKSDFIDLVKWGEIFNSINEKINIKEQNGVYVVEEFQNSERIQFLYGKKLKINNNFYY